MRSRLSFLLRMALIVAVLAVLVFFVFPLVFKPRIDVPTGLQFATASSLDFRISNQNLTPFTDVQYVCQLSNLTLANGAQVENAKSIIRGSARRIPGRHAIAGRCEAGYIVTDPLKMAEYKVTMTYKAYPWPQERTSQYLIGAQLNAKGEVTGWALR